MAKTKDVPAAPRTPAAAQSAAPPSRPAAKDEEAARRIDAIVALCRDSRFGRQSRLNGRLESLLLELQRTIHRRG